jgi:hypothetical protein
LKRIEKDEPTVVNKKDNNSNIPRMIKEIVEGHKCVRKNRRYTTVSDTSSCVRHRVEN